MDTTIMLYLYVVIVSAYALGLFTFWVRRHGWHGSAWYFYVMGLLLSHAAVHGLNAFARYMRLAEDPYYFEFLDTPFWSGRLIIGAITVTAIAVHATLRLRNGQT